MINGNIAFCTLEVMGALASFTECCVQIATDSLLADSALLINDLSHKRLSARLAI